MSPAVVPDDDEDPDPFSEEEVDPEEDDVLEDVPEEEEADADDVSEPPAGSDVEFSDAADAEDVPETDDTVETAFSSAMTGNAAVPTVIEEINATEIIMPSFFCICLIFNFPQPFLYMICCLKVTLKKYCSQLTALMFPSSLQNQHSV